MDEGLCAVSQGCPLVGVGHALEERLSPAELVAPWSTGPALECAGSSMIVRLPGREAEEKISNPGGATLGLEMEIAA